MRFLLFLFFCLYHLAAWGQDVKGEGSQAGQPAPVVLSFDCDAFYPFNGGAAVVSKGKLSALIDADLRVLVPYGIYDFGDGVDFKWAKRGGGNGLFEVRMKNGDKGIVNNAGRLLLTCDGFDEVAFEEWPGGFAWIRHVTPRVMTVDYTCINAAGRKIVLHNTGERVFGRWHDGLVEFHIGMVSGFMDMNGRDAIPAQYADVRDFSEGLAAVAKRDAFGEIKWGFIDRTGKTVIPFRYSNAPSPFGCGLSIVRPKTITDVKFSLIDRRGETVRSFPPTTEAEPLQEPFINGMQWGGRYGAMDTLGNVFYAMDVIKRCAVPVHDLPLEFEAKRDNRWFIYRDWTAENGDRFGMIDINTRAYFPAVFAALTFFDDVANLAYARVKLGRDEVNHTDIYREGYIDRHGQFVIVKKPAGENW